MNIFFIIFISVILNSYCNPIKKNILRFIVFKKKTFPKIKNLYYNKSITSLFDGINKYLSLSEEDKIIIETIIDLLN